MGILVFDRDLRTMEFFSRPSGYGDLHEQDEESKTQNTNDQIVTQCADGWIVVESVQDREETIGTTGLHDLQDSVNGKDSSYG
jgi:hypothetical protein